jgi:hypothetical protein
MTTTGTVTPLPPTGASAAAWRAGFWAGLHGVGQWVGEAVIGLIPLAIYQGVHRYSSLPITATCPKQTPNQVTQTLASCTAVTENSSQEVCILAVVISGLAVLSVVPLGLQKPRKITIWTRILILLAVVALIFGSLFYGLFTAHLDREATSITYNVLYVALLSSFFLAVEGAILNA